MPSPGVPPLHDHADPKQCSKRLQKPTTTCSPTYCLRSTPAPNQTKQEIVSRTSRLDGCLLPLRYRCRPTGRTTTITSRLRIERSLPLQKAMFCQQTTTQLLRSTLSTTWSKALFISACATPILIFQKPNGASSLFGLTRWSFSIEERSHRSSQSRHSMNNPSFMMNDPRDSTIEAIKLYHDGSFVERLDDGRNYELLARLYCWLKLHRNIQHCRSCRTCARANLRFSSRQASSIWNLFPHGQGRRPPLYHIIDFPSKAPPKLLFSLFTDRHTKEKICISGNDLPVDYTLHVLDNCVLRDKNVLGRISDDGSQSLPKR
jgi:hypothetical protein